MSRSITAHARLNRSAQGYVLEQLYCTSGDSRATSSPGEQRYIQNPAAIGERY